MESPRGLRKSLSTEVGTTCSSNGASNAKHSKEKALDRCSGIVSPAPDGM